MNKIKETPSPLCIKSHLLGKLKSELVTCAVCLETFENPRTLPCLHSFCQKCLIQTFCSSNSSNSSDTSFQKLTLKKTFPCPTCRKLTEIPIGNDILGFPRDFRTARLVEYFNSIAVYSMAFACGFCDNKSSSLWQCSACNDRFCTTCFNSLHMGKPFEHHLSFRIWQPTDAKICRGHQKTLTHFCSTCKGFLCILCIHEHETGHQISESHLTVSQQQDHLLHHLRRLQKQHVETTELICQTVRNESKIRDLNDESKRAIQNKCRDLINAIQNKERELLCQLAYETNKCFGLFIKRKKLLQIKLSRNESLMTEILTLLMYPDSDQKLEYSERVLAQCKENLDDCMQNVLNGTQAANFVKFSAAAGMDVGALIETTISIDTCPRTSNETMSELEVNYKSYEKQTPQVQKGKLCETKCQSIRSTVNTFEEETKGYRDLHVVCNPKKGLNQFPKSVDLMSANFEASMATKRCARLRCIIQGFGNSKGQIDMPFSISFMGPSEVVVGELGNRRLQVFGLDGEHRGFLCEGQLLPRSITSDSNGKKLIVADEVSKSLKFIDVTSNTSDIIAIDPVKYPFGVSKMSNGDFIITDKIFGSVSQLTKGGIFVKAIGADKDKSDKTQFLNPSFVQVSDNDTIFVSDTGNHDIKIFDKDGRFQSKLGEWGVDDGQFRYPSGIALCDNGLFVADSGNDRIVQIAQDGKCLGSIVDKDMGLRQPVCLCVDRRGSMMAVSLPTKNEVRVYDLSASIPKVV